MGDEFHGLICALGAAVAFGVQYVPVKRYEIFDGATFQWFMCSGILMVGFLIALFSGNLGEGSCCSNLVIFGGVLWALSNYFVLPLVKLLGIGLGFSLYHFVNLMVGYAVGRFGLFDVPRLRGDLVMCDLGCCLILVSFVIMVFVEVEEDDVPKRKGSRDLYSTPDTQKSMSLPGSWGASDRAYRESYRRWRAGGEEAQQGAAAEVPDYLLCCLAPASPSCPEAPAKACGEPAATLSFPSPTKADQVDLLSSIGSVMYGLSTSECGGHQYLAVGGFGLLSTPRLGKSFRQPEPEEDGFKRGASDPGVYESGSLVERLLQGKAAVAGSSAPLARLRLRVMGVSLAVAGGGLCGVQSVPATLHNAAFPGQSPLAVVFPQCLGIWVASSLIYIVYSTVARLWGWPVPHSVIRPAYASGCIWCVGFTLMIAGISDLGYSVGYTLDAVGPIVVSSLLSLLVFQEISGMWQVMLYSAAFTLQMIGVLLIANFGEAGN